MTAPLKEIVKFKLSLLKEDPRHGPLPSRYKIAAIQFEIMSNFLNYQSKRPGSHY